MKTDLNLIIAEGEGQTVEFKERLSRMDREIVAFANASGGAIFVGITDNGEIPGIEITNELTSRVQDTARNCDPPVDVTLYKHRSMVLEVRVAEGQQKPHQCHDGFFLRNGPNTQKLKRSEIMALALATGVHRFDESLNAEFRYPEDFDRAAFDYFLSLSGVGLVADTESILLSLDVAEEQDASLRLRQAAVLFFAREPQRFLKESMVTCVRYRGSDRFNVIDRAEILGSPIAMIEDSLKFVKRNTAVSYEIDGNAQHKELYTYPLPAVREAIINAVMHRDYYYDGSHVYVHIFSDRLEIENPGGLPAGLTLADLGKRSVRRNRAVADLLYRAKFIERIGSGIQRMESSLAQNGNPPMEISATNFFVVKFYPRVQTVDNTPLTSRQNTLYQLALARHTIRKGEAAIHLGVSNDTALREIKTLMSLGLLQQTGSGKRTRYIPAG
jgi:ATP-dependent DNA helicase RecG